MGRDEILSLREAGITRKDSGPPFLFLVFCTPARAFTICKSDPHPQPLRPPKYFPCNFADMPIPSFGIRRGGRRPLSLSTAAQWEKGNPRPLPGLCCGHAQWVSRRRHPAAGNCSWGRGGRGSLLSEGEAVPQREAEEGAVRRAWEGGPWPDTRGPMSLQLPRLLVYTRRQVAVLRFAAGARGAEGWGSPAPGAPHAPRPAIHGEPRGLAARPVERVRRLQPRRLPAAARAPLARAHLRAARTGAGPAGSQPPPALGSRFCLQRDTNWLTSSSF